MQGGHGTMLGSSQSTQRGWCGSILIQVVLYTSRHLQSVRVAPLMTRISVRDIAISADAWQVVLPLERPIGTPVGPFREVSCVVVRLRDDAGLSGCGYSLAYDALSFDHLARSVKRLLAEQSSNLADLVRIERVVDDGGDGMVRKAVSAISLASWDLLGRRTGRACADLWGRPPQRAALPAYASALFLDRSAHELVDEARALKAAGYRSVKMRGGKSPAEDAARFDAVRRVYAEPRSVAIDFVFQWDLARTREFSRLISAAPMWIEDPVTYDLIGAFGADEGLAAGESCESAAALVKLHAGGIGRLILDVECLGGPLRFLEAARILQALGCEVGSHTFAHESIHLLAALPDSMPVEMLDWWNPLFNEVPAPNGDGAYAVEGPGLGRTLREETLERFGKAI